MLIRRAPRFTASEITDPKLYLSRRELISGTVAALVLRPGQSAGATPQGQPLSATRNAGFSLNEPATKFEHAGRCDRGPGRSKSTGSCTSRRPSTSTS